MATKENGFSLLELLLALFLGAIILLTVFKIAVVIQQQNQQAQALSEIQSNMRFLSYFLREKIQMAGNASCSLKPPDSQLPMIKIYSQLDAKTQLGISIKNNSNALLLRECFHDQDAEKYLSLVFFIANNNNLFYKISNNKSEKLISNINNFSVFLKNSIIKINYSLYFNSLQKSAVLIAAKRADS